MNPDGSGGVALDSFGKQNAASFGGPTCPGDSIISKDGFADIRSLRASSGVKQGVEQVRASVLAPMSKHRVRATLLPDKHAHGFRINDARFAERSPSDFIFQRGIAWLCPLFLVLASFLERRTSIARPFRQFEDAVVNGLVHSVGLAVIC